MKKVVYLHKIAFTHGKNGKLKEFYYAQLGAKRVNKANIKGCSHQSITLVDRGFLSCSHSEN